MSQTAVFKCPSCGGYLEFDPQGQQFQCPYCGASFSEQEIHQQSQAKEQEAAPPVQEESLRSYHCQMCGAEIVTDATTAATRCYYCHHPVVLSDRLTDQFRPDGVIPFQLDRKQAEEKFSRFVKSKRFIDPAFFSARQLEDFSGVYYPYWMTDVEGDATFSGQGTRVDVASSGSKTVTTTRYYAVHREGRVTLRGMVRKALAKADRKLADGIHPYNMDELKPFAMGYLSGFLAEKRDVEADEIRDDVLGEARGVADGLMRQSTGYQSLTGESGFNVSSMKSKYMLLPAWVLTYKGEKGGEPFYYMMNGQTGAVCGRLPLKKSKLLLCSLLVGGAVAAVLCAGGAWIW